MENIKEMLVVAITFGVVLFIGDYIVKHSTLPMWQEVIILVVVLIVWCKIIFKTDQDEYEDEEEEEYK